MIRNAVCAGWLLALAGCSGYRDFTLPVQGPPDPVSKVEWRARPEPVLVPGPEAWDNNDVLNPSVIRVGGKYLNLYSGFDGRTWRTGEASSPDGLVWEKSKLLVLAPEPGTWEGNYIAANGAAVQFRGALFYLYQAGQPPRIGLARKSGGKSWNKRSQPVLSPGPFDSWDELGVADPYVFEAAGRLYLYYLGMDRARRQRLGLAVSDDGELWHKLLSNPIMELGEYGSFDENGLGEPAVWVANGSYWMLFTGRSWSEQRRLGIARSQDGVHWTKLPQVFTGEYPWDSEVLCDPSVLVEAGRIRVWFGGGDVARPDERIHGRVGYAELILQP